MSLDMNSPKGFCEYRVLTKIPVVNISESLSIKDESLQRDYEKFDAVMQSGLYDPRFEDGELKYRNLEVLVLSPSLPVGSDLSEVVQVVRAEYLMMLLLHPGAHPGLQEIWTESIGGDDGLAKFRTRLWRDLGGVGSPRILPVGVSGFIKDSSSGGALLITRRRGDLAINPRVWGPPVDGGLRSSDPHNDLMSEVASECAWLAGEDFESEPRSKDAWRFSGISFPSGDTAADGCAEVGVNFIFEAHLSEPDQRRAVALGTARGRSDEATEFRSIGFESWPRELTGARPSESLVAFLDFDSGSETGDLATWISTHSDAKQGSSWGEQELVTGQSLRQSDSEQRSGSGETRYSSRYFEALVGQVPGLSHADYNMSDEASTLAKRLWNTDPSQSVGDAHSHSEIVADVMKYVVPVVCYLRHSQGSTDSRRFESADFTRLYEASVYRTSHLLFGGSSKWPQYLAAALASPNQEERGTLVLDEAANAASQMLAAARAAQSVTGAGGLTEVPLNQSVLDELAADIRNSTVNCPFRVSLELFLFAVAMTGKREGRDADVAEYALSQKHRRWLSGNQMALFYKSSGLISARTPSLTQLRLGYEYCQSALAAMPGQAGVHHTAATYELRFDVVLPEVDRGSVWLERARNSSERAVSLDPEFPLFYATRAAIRSRAGQEQHARMDLETALELVLREPEAPPQWIETWEGALSRLGV
jgi:hypothetical protein